MPTNNTNPGSAAGQKPVRFAMIGDFGVEDEASSHEERVSSLVKGWNPDFIVTLGDNAYSDHNEKQNAFKVDVVDYYGEYVRSSAEDPDGTKTRFFPALGNHDYRASGSGVSQSRLNAYKASFAVPVGPGGHHYYQFSRGPVRFFVLDSNIVEGWKGYKTDSDQAKWLRKAVADATEPWKFVVFHHTPYQSSTKKQDEVHMRAWKFEEMGLTAAITGHAHHYERVMKGEFAYITNGIGGNSIYSLAWPRIAGSAVSYGRKEAGEPDFGNHRYGAIFAEATDASFTFEFWNVSGKRVDHWPQGAPELTKAPKIE